MKNKLIIFILAFFISAIAGAGAGIVYPVGNFSTLTATGISVYSGNVSVPNGNFTGSSGGTDSFSGGLSLNGNALTGVTTYTQTSGGATFGSLTAGTGSIIAAKSGAGPTTVPIAYTSGGAAVATTMHGVYGTVTGTTGAVAVTLTGAAIFAGTTYMVFACDLSTRICTAGITINSASQFTIATATTNTYAYYAEGV